MVILLTEKYYNEKGNVFGGELGAGWLSGRATGRG
jgi:hypothetical protein